MDDQSLKQAALYYHEFPTPGKISVTPSKQLVNQRDLALAYSPDKELNVVYEIGLSLPPHLTGLRILVFADPEE